VVIKHNKKEIAIQELIKKGIDEKTAKKIIDDII
jgi:hypothetical protein